MSTVRPIPSFVSLDAGEQQVRQYYVACADRRRVTGRGLLLASAVPVALALFAPTPEWLDVAVGLAVVAWLALRRRPARHAQVMLTNHRLIYFEYCDDPAVNVYTVQEVKVADITGVRASGRVSWLARGFDLTVSTQRRAGLSVGAGLDLVPAGDYVVFLQEIGALVARVQAGGQVSSGGALAPPGSTAPPRPLLLPVIAAGLTGVIALGATWFVPGWLEARKDRKREAQRAARVQLECRLGYRGLYLPASFERTQERLAEAFSSTAHPGAPSAARRTAEVLDAYASEWRAMARETCVASALGRKPRGVSPANEACLRARLDELVALVNVFGHQASRETVDRAEKAARSLRPLEACRQPLPPGMTPWEGDQTVRNFRERLVRLRAEYLTGGVRQSMARQVWMDVMNVPPDLEAEAALYFAAAQLAAGELADAEAAARRALAAAGKVHHSEVTVDASILLVGALAREPARIDDALAEEARARAALDAAGGRPEWLARLALSAGDALSRAGRHEDALARYREAQDAFGRASAPAPLAVAASLGKQGEALHALGRRDEALSRYREALAALQAEGGEDHPIALEVVAKLAGLLGEQGQHDDAIALLRRRVDLVARGAHDGDVRVIHATDDLGAALAAAGKIDDAIREHERALSLRERTFGGGHIEMAEPLARLAELHLVAGRWSSARAAADRAAGVIGTVARAGDGLDPARLALAGVFDRLGQAALAKQAGEYGPAEAVSMLSRAWDLRQAGKASEVELAATTFALARAYWDSRLDRRHARQLAEQARAAFAAAGAKDALDEVDRWRRKHR